jgi:hypothetical protein
MHANMFVNDSRRAFTSIGTDMTALTNQMVMRKLGCRYQVSALIRVYAQLKGLWPTPYY